MSFSFIRNIQVNTKETGKKEPMIRAHAWLTAMGVKPSGPAIQYIAQVWNPDKTFTRQECFTFISQANRVEKFLGENYDSIVEEMTEKEKANYKNAMTYRDSNGEENPEEWIINNIPAYKITEVKKGDNLILKVERIPNIIHDNINNADRLLLENALTNHAKDNLANWQDIFGKID